MYYRSFFSQKLLMTMHWKFLVASELTLTGPFPPFYSTSKRGSNTLKIFQKAQKKLQLKFMGQSTFWDSSVSKHLPLVYNVHWYTFLTWFPSQTSWIAVVYWNGWWNWICAAWETHRVIEASHPLFIPFRWFKALHVFISLPLLFVRFLQRNQDAFFLQHYDGPKVDITSKPSLEKAETDPENSWKKIHCWKKRPSLRSVNPALTSYFVFVYGLRLTKRLCLLSTFHELLFTKVSTFYARAYKIFSLVYKFSFHVGQLQHLPKFQCSENPWCFKQHYTDQYSN